MELTGHERWVWERSAGQPTPRAPPRASRSSPPTYITQQKATEVERRIEFEQQLIGIVSHDLRHPLHSIARDAGMLLRREGLNASGTRQVRRILASAERAARMVRDLLDFTHARLGGGIPVVPQEVSLGLLIAQVVEEFDASHPERRITHEGQGSLEGRFDSDRIKQALTNLVDNAVSYSPPDTPVVIRSRHDGRTAVIESTTSVRPSRRRARRACFSRLYLLR